MKKGQASTALILVVVLIIAIILIVAVVLLTQQPKSSQYVAPQTTQTPVGQNSANSWCIPGDSSDLSDLGVSGYATIIGMTSFQGQSLCRANFYMEGQTLAFYTDELTDIWYITDTSGNILASYLDLGSQTPIQTGQGGPTQGGPTPSDSGIFGDQGGTISSNGASLTIPARAFSGNRDFTITKKTTSPVSMLAGYPPVGGFYDFGPDTEFASPVRIDLPIPDDADIDDIIGLAYLDSGEWNIIPGGLDRIANTIYATTDHLSLWTIVGGARNSWYDGQYFRVVNTHRRATGSYPLGYPACLGKVASTSYGICIDTWTPTDPEQDELAWWFKGGIIWSYNNDRGNAEVNYWMPPGKFNLIEIVDMSEVNNDPLYSPCYSQFWRPIGQKTLSKGQTMTLSGGSPVNDPDASGWISSAHMAPPCSATKKTDASCGCDAEHYHTTDYCPPGQYNLFDISIKTCGEMNYDRYRACQSVMTYQGKTAVAYTRPGESYYYDCDGAKIENLRTYLGLPEDVVLTL